MATAIDMIQGRLTLQPTPVPGNQACTAELPKKNRNRRLQPVEPAAILPRFQGYRELSPGPSNQEGRTSGNPLRSIA